MNKIQQIQTVLNVTADGDFGPISYDALDDALQDPDTIKQIQGILGVAQDGDWGPLTRGAFQAALQPQTPAGWSRVITSEFADDSDLNAYNAAIAAGKTQEEAFAVGDNCIGCWGDPTGSNNPNPSPMLALPPEIMEITWGKPWKTTAKHQNVSVQNPASGNIVQAMVADVMPNLVNITNGAGMDANPSLCNALGLPDGAMVPVFWQPA